MTEKNKIRLGIYLAAIAVLLSVGSIGFVLIGNMSLTDAIYFSIVTMATVGYGDVHPQTEMGKLLTLILPVGGVGTFLGVIARITDLFVNRRKEIRSQSRCPASDRKHLEKEIVRVDALLIFEWLRYTRCLKRNYGHLFSLSMRASPFGPTADAVVKNT